MDRMLAVADCIARFTTTLFACLLTPYQARWDVDTRAGLAAGGATLPGYLPQQTTIRPRSPGGGGSAADLTGGGRQARYGGDGSAAGSPLQSGSWMQQQQQQQQMVSPPPPTQVQPSRAASGSHQVS